MMPTPRARGAAHWPAAVLLLFLALWVPAVAAAPEYPSLTGPVVDQANLLTGQSRAALEQKLEQHERATGNQVVVVTVSSLQGESIEEYGVGLGRAWGIGREGEDDGVLLVVAPNEREVRIEVGYGLEGTLTDALSSQIIQNEILPRFRDGDMNAGIVAGTEAILAALGGTYEAEAWSGQAAAAPQEPPIPEWAIPLLFFGVWLFIVFIVRRGRRGRRRGIWMGVPGVGGFGTGGFSGRRGGFSGGGFRGGGGSFGGGGATGRW